MHPTDPSLPLTDAAWLDTHFRAMRPEYERMLRSVGIERGWRVLDAGCGTGTFLPILRELVGESGQIFAVDLEQTAIARVRADAALAKWSNVHAQVCDVCELHRTLKSHTPFDAIWCANVTQYLSDVSLRAFLDSCRQSLRPGGLLAIKEYDGQAMRIEPLPAGLLERLHQARCSAGVTHALALRRTASLGAYLESAGFALAQATPTIMDRRAPLDPDTREFTRSLFEFLSAEAAKYPMTPADQIAWKALANFDSPDHPLQRTDFLYHAVQWTVVGRA